MGIADAGKEEGKRHSAESRRSDGRMLAEKPLPFLPTGKKIWVNRKSLNLLWFQADDDDGLPEFSLFFHFPKWIFSNFCLARYCFCFRERVWNEKLFIFCPWKISQA
jgi:hypothetical protein